MFLVKHYIKRIRPSSERAEEYFYVYDVSERYTDWAKRSAIHTSMNWFSTPAAAMYALVRELRTPNVKYTARAVTAETLRRITLIRSRRGFVIKFMRKSACSVDCIQNRNYSLLFVKLLRSLALSDSLRIDLNTKCNAILNGVHWRGIATEFWPEPVRSSCSSLVR